MKESHVEGLANHDDPESCVDARKGGREAWTGVRAGRANELRNAHPASGRFLRGVDAVPIGGRPHRAARQGQRRGNPAQSATSRMYGTISHGNRESLWSPVASATGRIGKSMDVRR